ncbi:MAG: hypothetical protein HC935_07510 [Pseudanabaena sp. SU_2_4]|nr:hypothetical protein [Pseudanabaena sp. SU_2_4]
MGLAISQNLVQLMGGKIGVTSILEKGTIFNFYIPVLPIDLSFIHPSSSPQLLRELLPSQPPPWCRSTPRRNCRYAS